MVSGSCPDYGHPLKCVQGKQAANRWQLVGSGGKFPGQSLTGHLSARPLRIPSGRSTSPAPISLFSSGPMVRADNSSDMSPSISPMVRNAGCFFRSVVRISLPALLTAGVSFALAGFSAHTIPLFSQVASSARRRIGNTAAAQLNLFSEPFACRGESFEIAEPVI